ncbi:two-component system, sensor histidine kinase [Thermoflexales bacterium]|nr:two-component system, sensor histidine kinase [Thermoflexales bacterium]
MSLRIKSLLVAAFTTAILLVTFLLFTRLILTDSYTQLEQQDTTAHVERAVNALTNDLAGLARTANDYAAWDDTFNFIESRDPVYLEANYPDATFINNRLSVVTIVDTQGEIIFAKAFDLDQEQEIPVAPEISDLVSSHPAFLRPAQSISSTVGIWLLSTGPVLVAVQPILTSDGAGPPRGALLMGRVLSANEIAQLSEVTQLTLAVHPSGAALPPEAQAALSALSAQQPLVVRPLNEQIVQGYTWLHDITAQPAFLLRVDRARDIYQQGQATFAYLALALVVGGLAMGGVLTWVLQRTVISRLGRLNREVQTIGARGDLTQRVSAQGQDELGSLAAEMNRMLASLENTQRLLRQREREAITLLDSIPAFAFFKDTAGRYVVANQKFCEALQRTREEVVGKTDYDFYPPERAERYRVDDFYVTERGETHEVSEETIGQEPNAIVLATKKVPLKDESGQAIGLIGLAFDITERKRAAQELAVARDQALAALRFKSQLLANVSHDLRTPISAILGFAEMLLAEVYGPLQEQQLEPLTRIVMDCNQLGRLVSDLLDQSRLEAGKLTLRFRPFAPADLIESIKASAGLSARDKGLELIGLVAPDVPPEIQGDYERVHQVVLNLIDNALRFTQEGSVTVHITRQDPVNYAIQVSDTGPGIAPDEQALVFETFQQGSVQAPGRYKGLGLGLSIVKQLVTLMGGQVTLDSQLGQGTTFTISLPLAPETKGQA